MKVGTRTCLDWNTCDFPPPSPRLLEQVEQAERGLLVDGVVQLALGVQPAHSLLAVTGDQRTLDRTGGAALRTRRQAFLPAGFPHPVFHGGLFSDDYLTLCRAHSKPTSQEPILGYAPSLVQAQGARMRCGPHPIKT